MISSPLVDLASFLLLVSFFGFRIALAYVVVGLVLAVVGGTLIDRMGLEGEVADFVRDAGGTDLEPETLTTAQRISFSHQQVRDIVRRVWLYVFAGVGIGALIHNWIPQTLVEGVLGQSNPFSVVLATAVGVPMYADIFGTLPIAEALFGKGVGLGTILAFMMAVTALSMPSLVMLSQVVKRRLLLTFTGLVTVGILIIGYLFNAVQFWLVH